MEATATKCDRCCELCGKSEVVLVEMQPGPDGVPWWLCIRDYVDGLFPGKLGRIPAAYRNDLAVTKVTTGEAVIPSTGQKMSWTLTRREPEERRSKAKDDVGSFEKPPKPPAKKRKAG